MSVQFLLLEGPGIVFFLRIPQGFDRYLALAQFILLLVEVFRPLVLQAA
jgi:hypothetical protein